MGRCRSPSCGGGNPPDAGIMYGAGRIVDQFCGGVEKKNEEKKV